MEAIKPRQSEDEIVKQINDWIAQGIIKTDLIENESMLAQVWGIYAMRFNAITWRKRQSGFLGAGLFSNTWYELATDKAKIKTGFTRLTSLRMFYNYVKKHI